MYVQWVDSWSWADNGNDHDCISTHIWLGNYLMCWHLMLFVIIDIRAHLHHSSDKNEDDTDRLTYFTCNCEREWLLRSNVLFATRFTYLYVLRPKCRLAWSFRLHNWWNRGSQHNGQVNAFSSERNTNLDFSVGIFPCSWAWCMPHSYFFIGIVFDFKVCLQLRLPLQLIWLHSYEAHWKFCDGRILSFMLHCGMLPARWTTFW